MKLTDYIAQFLTEKGISHVFGYQGGSVTHLIDSIARLKEIQYVQNYNEQASALCADAYARVAAERTGVAIASNGPGATNLITGIANAYCDSVPVIFITGQVHTYAMRNNSDIRQESFQEIDITSMVKAITKYAVTIMSAEQIKYELEKSYFIANTGRPGPVLIDIPVDIQGENIDINNIKSFKEDGKRICANKSNISELISTFYMSSRPLIIAGGGINVANCVKEFREFVNAVKVPVVVSLQALSVLEHNSPYFLGFCGSYGNRCANIAIQHADCILVLGSRLDARQTGKKKEEFAPNAKIIHVDIDSNELRHTIKKEIPVLASLNDFFKISSDVLDKSSVSGSEQWEKWICELKRHEFDADRQEGWNPNVLMHVLGNRIRERTIVALDVGQNQMWAAQSLRTNTKELRILSSGGLGTMGYALPASIAAYYARPENDIICITGDGGIQMNIQEMSLIGNQQLPIKIFLINNKSLGLIRDIHRKYYDGRYVGSVDGFGQPDFQQLSMAYGIEYWRLGNTQMLNKIDDILLCPKPCLIECLFENDTYIRPELLGKDTLDNQYPYLSVEELKSLHI